MHQQERTHGPQRLHARLKGLKALRDEIRVRLHLAGMDGPNALLRTEFAIDKAEHHLRHMADDAAGAVATTLDEIAATLRTIHQRTKHPSAAHR